MDTGIPEIDVVEEQNAYSINLTLGAINGANNLRKGDIVYQFANGSATGSVAEADATATVLSYDQENPGILILTDIVGSWGITGITGQSLYVTKSDNSLYSTVIGIGDKFGVLIDENNKGIQDEANTFLDFTESHPFGDPT